MVRFRESGLWGQPMDQVDIQKLTEHFTARPALGVASAYLFGSHAEGRAHRESDVDLGVLLHWDRYPSRQERFEVRVRLGSELIAVLHQNAVDLVILNDVPPLFGRHIVTAGPRIFLGDPQADAAFVCNVQLRAADLAPFLRKMRRIKLEALARQP
jgi:predicted nucleotidyltransferase